MAVLSGISVRAGRSFTNCQQTNQKNNNKIYVFLSVLTSGDVRPLLQIVTEQTAIQLIKGTL